MKYMWKSSSIPQGGGATKRVTRQEQTMAAGANARNWVRKVRKAIKVRPFFEGAVLRDHGGE